jgi:hypothetical protein
MSGPFAPVTKRLWRHSEGIGKGACERGHIRIAHLHRDAWHGIRALHQRHGTPVQAHAPHRLCRRFACDCTVDAVPVKTAECRDIGQGIQ